MCLRMLKPIITRKSMVISLHFFARCAEDRFLQVMNLIYKCAEDRLLQAIDLTMKQYVVHE